MDRTLIYSATALALPMPDEQAPRLLCVEVHQGRPLSYVTERAADLLTRLTASAAFVPVTTRTREQYRRVRLPGPPPAYAVCANGGHLLVHGRTDHAWHDQVRARLSASCAPLAEILDRVVRDAAAPWLHTVRVAEDLFVYAVVDRAALPDGWLAELTDWAAPLGWTVSAQGRKVYAVPAPLTKSAGLAEVVRRTGADRVLAAGDSLLDADLLLAADKAWRPGHGELAATGWTAAHVTALDTVGVLAGEGILRRMAAWVEEVG
nr:HAD family hydrolase [Streptomyces sp. SID5468]